MASMIKVAEATVEQWKVAVAAHPDDAQAWENLGNAYLSLELLSGENGLKQESLRCSLKVHALRPQDPQVLLRMAFLYRGLNEPEKALAAASQAYQIAPTDPLVIRWMADLSYSRKDYAAAEKFMAMERGRGPGWDIGRYARYGNALLQLARQEDVIAVLGPVSTPKAEERDSKGYSWTADDYGQVNYLLALAYLKNGDTRQARKYFKTAGEYFDFAKSGWHSAQQGEIARQLKELQ
jgi:tetratricopeptide (TPR) repeat protein